MIAAPLPNRKPEYGSDLIVDLMTATGIEYVALNPGATFRGLHDSIVNYGGNRNPELIQTCHEEIAVAIAHGYAKAAGRPMATICHNIVGLQHASMAIFNAWCDRVPIIVMGGTGPMDTNRRRPWIDWVHTALVQGQIVRDYVKWDDQPHTIGAVPTSYLRAFRRAITEPQGPVYLCYDVDLQEDRMPYEVPIPPVEDYLRTTRIAPEPDAVEEAARMLVEAEFPLIMADFMGRDPKTVPVLVQLAETLAAPVVDLGNRFNFPNTHPLDLTLIREELLTQADVVLVLEAQDLFGAVRSRVQKQDRSTRPLLKPDARLIHISLGELNTRAWSADYQEIHPVTLSIMADTSVAVPALLAAVRKRLGEQVSGRTAREERAKALGRRHRELREQSKAEAARRTGERIPIPQLVASVWNVIKDEPWMLANGHANGWARKLWDWTEPHQWIGTSSGAGLGYGMGAAMGAALAHRNRDMLCINLQTDGDFLYTASALWTAAHHELPLLTIMVNDRSYFNDEVHQELVAITRGRPVENRTIGIRIEKPEVNFAKMAEAQGVYAEGPVTDQQALDAVLRRAVAYVKNERKPALVDVVVASERR